MNKKEKQDFDNEVKEEFDVIRQAVHLIAGKMASRYELEIYRKLNQFCERQIQIINEVDEYSIGLACKRIKQVMEGGKK